MKPPEPTKDKPDAKKKGPEAERAVMKPKAVQEPESDKWAGGIDHFDERV